MPREATLVWFRLDLRLGDNPALLAALQRGGPVVPVFVWAPEEEGAWPPGAAGRWWLHQSLKALDSSLRRIGSRLVIRKGPGLDTLQALAKETNANVVLWNRRYEPALIARAREIKAGLRQSGLIAESFNASLLHEPWEILTKAISPFQVFTPFWNSCLAAPPPGRPQPAPERLPAPKKWPDSLEIDDLALEPTVDWATGMRAVWTPGEAGASARFDHFLRDALDRYAEDRGRPDLSGSSCLSPHLHFGEISPRAIWHAIRDRTAVDGERPSLPGAEEFLKEVGWRDFAYHLLFHFPHSVEQPLRCEFAAFPWHDDGPALRSWRRGQTGYPLVDAGMRQLWATGWMHNRVRMVTASFLVKHLLLPWQDGAKWFWYTLVDADLANNTLGWQWTSGCAADAAPYFRIFNPVAQAGRFDPTGDYVRRWVPELARLQIPWIHKPWDAPASTLAEAGIVLGKTYPEPIVEHAAARQRALDAFASLARKR